MPYYKSLNSFKSSSERLFRCTNTYLYFYWYIIRFARTHLVQFSRSVVSNSLRPHESQHARPPCPSPTPRVHSNSCPSSRWCHPAFSSSVNPFSSCPHLSQHESFSMSQLFAWGGQSTGVSALASFQRKDRWLAHDQDMHFDLSFHSCLGSVTHIYKGGLCAICAHKTEKN